MSLWSFLTGIPARSRACEAAEALARESRPGEPILGSGVSAVEDERYVVRVFVGHRVDRSRMGPPWRECLIVAVAKADRATTLLTDDAAYRPIVR
jgi:hypothetical protein